MAEAYPTPLAGQRITASLLRSMQPQVVRKTSDTSRAATTTVTPDPHLQFDLVAGGVYVMDGWIKYDGPSAADLNIDWSVPSGTLGEWVGFGGGLSPMISFNASAVLVTDSQQSRGYTIRTESTDVAASRAFGTLGLTGVQLSVALYSTLRVGSVSGTYSLDWAQVTSDASPVTLYTDSWLRLQRIA
ncbi:hypothetical protein [Streptomyces sp. SCL15-4]|uniref:hypothetical protein n=1 Tax=Streptomyces sp. SCL15-4 TaxID=2967221 RepID=UPI0029677640|nr:hypothetical protein [Streptomyces sp. SCL15-4]